MKSDDEASSSEEADFENMDHPEDNPEEFMEKAF